MHQMTYFCQLIIIGALTWSAVVSTPVSKKKNDFHLMFENNWPDLDPNINHYPHPTSCHYFYLVLSEEDISIEKCPDGKLFDYFEHKCVQKGAARCWSQHFSGINHGHNHMHKTHRKFKCPYAYGKFPDINDCRRYYQCLSGKSKSKKCAPFEYFDKIKRKCMAEINAVCADETDVVEYGYKCPRTWGSFSYSIDCSKYYECIEKRPDLRTCPRHTLFDENKRRCVSNKSVRCGLRHNPYEKKTISSLSTPTSVSTQRTDDVIDIQKDTSEAISQYPGSSPNPQFSTMKETEASLIVVSKADEKDNIIIEEVNIPTKDNDSSENDISMESEENFENPNKNNSKNSTEESQKAVSNEPMKNSHEDVSREPGKNIHDSSENDISKESNEYSKISTKGPNKYVSKELAKDYHKGVTESKKNSHKEVLQEPMKDSHEDIVNKSTEISNLDASIVTNEFITTVNTTSSDDNSIKLETVTTSNGQSSNEIYTSTMDSKVCRPEDRTCILEKDRVIRCPAANGLYPHPEDERRFLHCTDFKIHLKICPKKLIFKDVLKACAWPLRVVQKSA